MRRMAVSPWQSLGLRIPCSRWASARSPRIDDEIARRRENSRRSPVHVRVRYPPSGISGPVTRRTTRSTGPTRRIRLRQGVPPRHRLAGRLLVRLRSRRGGLAQVRVMDLILGAEGDRRPGMMGPGDPPRDDRLPEHPIADRPELCRHHHPSSGRLGRAGTEEETARVDMAFPVAFLRVGVHQGPVRTMDRPAGRANSGPRPPVERDHRLDVVGVVPVIGIEEGDGVVPPIHRRERADAARGVADVVVRTGQGSKVLDVPVRPPP